MVHPKKAFMVGALEKEIRLSFAQRIRGTLPEPYQPLISEAKEKDTPDFKFNDERKSLFSPSGKSNLTISAQTVKDREITKCFTETHSDAVAWLPGNSIHETHWKRLVVQDIYWIGGFGDRARIGWLPLEEWRNVTMKEVHEIRLPGEEGENDRRLQDGRMGLELR